MERYGRPNQVRLEWELGFLVYLYCAESFLQNEFRKVKTEKEYGWKQAVCCFFLDLDFGGCRLKAGRIKRIFLLIKRNQLQWKERFIRQKKQHIIIDII